MKRDEIFDRYQINFEKLLQYGFQQEDDNFVLKQELDNDLYVKFIVKQNSFRVFVYDHEDQEYLPFRIVNMEGGYASSIKEKVQKIIDDILASCFDCFYIRDHLLEYVHDKYGTVPEYPWEDTPFYATLKKNNKWYCLFMDISYKTLGISKDGIIDVINIKIDPERIQKLIDYKNFFPAYHMNKKYWITVLLNDQIPFSLITELLDESYQNVKE